MELIIAIIAVIVAGVAVVVAARRPAGQEAQAMEAVRNDLNLLRETTDRSIKQITDVFSQQLQGISSNVQNAIGALNQNVAQRLAENAKSLQSNSEAVAQRIATVQSTFAGLQKQVGEMSEQARALAEVSKVIVGLDRALTAPKQRGGFGETQLETLLAMVFPRENFQMQYTFPKSGETADAILRFPQGMVAIDSKFPLPNFRRIAEAESEADKRAARRDFLKDVRKRMDEIAEKYIRPDEGTLPFALMFVPAENVYYEAVIREEGDGKENLWEYGIDRRVVPVSPNSLYAYLQTIMVGLKSLVVSQRAEAILHSIESLSVELGKFAEIYETVGKHLRNARERYEDGERALAKVENRVENLAGSGQAALEFEEGKRALGAAGE